MKLTTRFSGFFVIVFFFITTIANSSIGLRDLQVILEAEKINGRNKVVDWVSYREKNINGQIQCYPHITKMKSSRTVYVMDLNGNIEIKEELLLPSVNFKRFAAGEFFDNNSKFNFKLFDENLHVINEQILDPETEYFDEGIDFISDNGLIGKISRYSKDVLFFDSTANYVRSAEIFPNQISDDNTEIFTSFLGSSDNFVVFTEKYDRDKFKDFKIENPPVIFTQPLQGIATLDEKITKPNPHKAEIPESQQKNSPVIIAKPKPDPEQNLALVCFNTEGNEIWRNYIDSIHLWPKKLSVSNDGEYIIAISGGFRYKGHTWPYCISLFQNNGALVRRIDREMEWESGIPVDFQCAFSPNNKYCYVGNANWIIKIDTRDGSVLWEKEFPWDSRTVNWETQALVGIEVGQYNDEDYIFLLREDYVRGAFNHYNPQLYMLSQNGDELATYGFQTEGYTTYSDKKPIRVSPDMSHVYFYFGNKIYDLTIERSE